MYGSIFSIMLMGIVPVWGARTAGVVLAPSLSVSPPALHASVLSLESLTGSVTAKSVIIVDLESGQTVFERDAKAALPMASLTKLMTALVIVETHALDERVTIPADITSVIGNKAGLPAGEEYTVGNLLSALLIESANDAAVTLARYHSGSIEKFADEMNERAKELGLKTTTYQNPTGLDAPTQESSARDLAWLAMFVMKYPAIAERMSTPTTDIYSVSGKSLTLVHTHQLLRADDSDILAGKTGTTDAAGQCLLSIIEEDGRRYIAVLLHSEDRYADMQHILEAFKN